MASFDIPEHWSNEQALAVYEFLSQLQDRIWEYYEVPLVETIRHEIAADLLDEPVDSSEFNNDLPFGANRLAVPIALNPTAYWRTAVADTTVVRLLGVFVFA